MKNYCKIRHMKTNEKKPITVKNNTHYFVPTKTKVQNTFINPRTFYARQNKIEGYENRLYWEWVRTNKLDGQTFFYTLTYNNANIPQYNGENCFDYEDLRQLLNGGFTKKLLRNYGTKMKYFVGAELGEGKGKRGDKNNPHYHILFFLTDAKDERYKYNRIDPLEFRNLIRIYWQGEDQDQKGYSDYKKFKKGIVKEGENLGLVTDYRAIVYCAKYVTKDVGLIKREAKIEEEIRKKWHNKISCCAESYERFWEEEIERRYNIPKYCTTNEIKEYVWKNKELCKILGVIEKGNIKWDCLADLSFAVIEELKLQQRFYEKCQEYLKEKVKNTINEYRNRYCNKCRLSQGVGTYALIGINEENPKIGIYTKSGYKERNLNLYYYRKLYCNVVKDPLGNNKYILNEKGINYKKAKLKDKIEKLTEDTIANLSWLTEEKYQDIQKSDINTSCIATWEDINTLRNYEEKRNIARRYAIYKLVYEGRFYKIENNGLPKIDVDSDFTNFITPEYTTTHYDIDPVSNFLQNGCESYMAYNTHPYFLQDHYFYTLFDTISDYLFIQEDDRREKEEAERKKVRRYHKQLQFNHYLKTI